MSSLSPVLLSLWSSIVAVAASVDWLSVVGYLLASGGVAAVRVFWLRRDLWGARIPFLAAAFELVDVFGFSPTLLGEWVRRRSWYRRGQDETGRLRRLWPGAVLIGLCFAVACGCSGAPLTSCPVPDMTRATLPAALTLARSVLTLAEASCGSACPAELHTAQTAVDATDATADDVCRAIPIVRRVPCEPCSGRLEELSALLACETSP